MLVDETYARAVDVLKKNATPRGLKASHAYYNQVWARDSFVSFLGANMIGDEDLHRCARETINIFAKTRSELGQIANFYDPGSGQADFGFSGSTDSSSWFIIGLANLFKATGDRSLLMEPLEAALDAYKWLRYQDANNSWLIDSPQGADWMDAAIQRTGKTLYNNILFILASRCIDLLCSAASRSLGPPYRLDYPALLQRFTDVFLPSDESQRRVRSFWPRLAEQQRSQKPMGLSQEYFLHYVSFARIDTHFDTLSNLICLLAGPCELKTSLSIVATIRARGLTEPFPVRVLDPPYRQGQAGFDARFNETLPVQHRSEPFAYHNGAAWPFVGGFYVCALNRLGIDAASSELERLAMANGMCRNDESVGFNEWLHGKTGEPLGQFGQSWSAGMYLAAFLSGRHEDPLSFIR